MNHDTSVLADDDSAASTENDPSGAGGATGAVISSDRHGDGFPVVLANRCPMQSFLTGSPYSRSDESRRWWRRSTQESCQRDQIERRTNPGSGRCLIMRHKTQISAGPMSNQRSRDFAISPSLPLMPAAAEPSEGPTSRQQATRADAVRSAKARISRRRSLEMQREAQKARSS